jgi:rod shape-determining protein MreD
MNRGGSRAGAARASGRDAAVRSGFGLLVVWLLAALLARGTLSDLLAVAGARPDFLAMLLVYWALATGPMAGTAAGFLVGLVADAGLGRGLGLQSGLLSLAGYVVGHAGKRLTGDNPFLQGGLVGIVAAALGLTRAAALPAGAGGWGGSVSLVLGSALYSALLGPALYWLVLRLGVPDPLSRVPADE